MSPALVDIALRRPMIQADAAEGPAMRKVIVINPNSTEAVTEALRDSVALLAASSATPIECVTLMEGPPGVETQLHRAQVVEPMCRLIRSLEREAGAFVVACFADPGLQAAREATARPVLGMAEASMLMALAIGESFGIISTRRASVKDHRRYVRQLGLSARCAGDVAIDLGILELQRDPSLTLDRLIGAGRRLRDEHGADVLLTGCAGMAPFRGQIQEALGIRVLEPCYAAVSIALGAARLD
jgi:Asp/Glu/hydantoin racemase